VVIKEKVIDDLLYLLKENQENHLLNKFVLSNPALELALS
jgi:hypothetical protein